MEINVLQPIYNNSSTRFGAWFGLQLIAFLLLASWFWPTTQTIWFQLDYQVFDVLNGSLQWNTAWQWLWGLTNCRPFDGIVFLFFLLTVTLPDWVFAKKDINKVFVLLAVTSVMALIIRYGMKYFFDIKRNSPSIVIEHAIRLHDLLPNLAAKDKSHGSFPGDHATLTLVWWGIVMLYTHKYLWRYVSTALMVFILLPRLIAGAHWLTDDLIGGFFVALIAIAWVCHTPLQQLALRIGVPLLPQNWIKHLFFVKQ